jgi:hypothetical protein
MFFGERLGGKIDSHESQYGCTRFFHVLFLPLIPTAGLWVVSEERDEAHETRYSPRSIVSGYLRTWMPVLTLGQIYFGGAPGLLTYSLLGLAGATCSWWTLRGRMNRLTASMFARSLGSSCPTRLLGTEVAAVKLEEAEAKWRDSSSGRTLQDVARFGAESPAEAALAVTILRLRVRLGVGDRAESQSFADAILEGAHEVSALDMGGPMRARALPKPSEPDQPEA